MRWRPARWRTDLFLNRDIRTSPPDSPTPFIVFRGTSQGSTSSNTALTECGYCSGGRLARVLYLVTDRVDDRTGGWELGLGASALGIDDVSSMR